MSQKKVSRRKILKAASLVYGSWFYASCGDSGTPENPCKNNLKY